MRWGALIFGAWLVAGVAGAEPAPPWYVRQAEAQRGPGGQLAFRLRTEGAPDAARVRILVDTEAGGEPGTGAEYMMEGAHVFRYPPGSPAWTWQELAPPQFFSASNELTCLLPPVTGFAEFGWAVETTNPDWTTAGRSPAQGYTRSSRESLPPLKTETLRRDVRDPHLDVTAVTAYRLEPSGMALRIATADGPDVARLRIMLDVNGPAQGEASCGADYMVEGATFFAYPAGGQGWTWNALEPALWIQDSNALTCLLFNLPTTGQVGWAVETTSADWQSADRMPVAGVQRADVSTLPALPPLNRPGPVDVGDLLARVPPSLSVRFEDELATQEWTLVTRDVPLAWTSPLSTQALPVRLYLTDAVTGQRAEMKPAGAFTSDSRRRWGGRTLDVDWVLVADEDDGGALALSGQLKAAEPRCVTLSAGVELDLSGWTWHDDVQTRRVMDAQGDYYANVSSLPYGRRGEQSPYPFGVVSSERGALVVETDVDEPRIYQIAAEPAERFIGIHYDLGLSPETTKFPGRAAFRCFLRAQAPQRADAFRAALSDFYRRHPDFLARRSPEVGLWMPFMDISKLPAAQDFGFAFYEQGGALGADVDYGESNHVLTLYYTEPWLYWLPMTPGMARTLPQAWSWMRTLGTTGNGLKNDFAASALVSTTLQTNKLPLLSFIDTPWNTGARMEVSTDPELPVSTETTVNRAMVEWKIVQDALRDPRVDGIYLDSMQAMQVIDYNPAALAVADYPASYAPDAVRPGLAMPVAAFEYTSALGRYLRERGKLLMGNFPCWRWPFFMPYIDIPGEETSWLGNGTYAPMEDRHLAFRRAISGHKPWGFLQAVNFKVFDSEMVERYFQDCLYWAFLPSFFSHDGANDPYWADASLYERDRPLFKTYLPLIRRLAVAGWEPLGPVSSDAPALRLEHFGNAPGGILHLTLRQAGALPLRAGLRVPRRTEEQVLVDPLTGHFDLVPAGDGEAVVPCLVAAHAVETRDLVPLSALAEEIAFARSWSSGGSEAQALAASLGSLDDERKLDAHVQVALGTPLVRERDQPVTVVISNAGADALQVSNVTFVGRTGPQLLRAEAMAIAPHASAQVDGFLDTRAVAPGTWLQFQWNLQRGRSRLLGRRMFKPLVAPPVIVAMATTNIVSVDAVAGLDVELYNVAGAPRSVTLRASGDFDVAPQDVALAPDERREVHLEIPSAGRAAGRLALRAVSGEQVVSDTGVRVTFLDDTASLGRDTRVDVEVDSTYGGYTTLPLTDGITDATGLPWNEGAWASEETAAPHWVRFVFPQPTALGELNIVWNHEGGVLYTSRRGLVRGRTYDGRLVPLGAFTNSAPVASTTVSFETLQLQSIELYQPVGGGPAARPNLLWLSEIEVR